MQAIEVHQELLRLRAIAQRDAVATRPPSPKLNRRQILEAAQLTPNFELHRYTDNPARWREDREVLLACVRANGCNLRWASVRLRKDRELVEAAVASNGVALAFAPTFFRADRDIVLSAVKTRGAILRIASPELRADPQIVRLAVAEWGAALAFCPLHLRQDRDLVLLAVQGCGSALEYVPQEFQDDKEIVLLALTSHKQKEHVSKAADILQFASERLRGDHQVVQAAVRANGGPALLHASLELQLDRELVWEAIDNSVSCEDVLGGLPHEIRNDREIVLRAIQDNGMFLMGASDELKANKEVVLQAVLGNGSALEFASDELKNDREVVRAALQDDHDEHTETSWSILQDYASPELSNDRELWKFAIQQGNGDALYGAPEGMQLDPEVVAVAAEVALKRDLKTYWDMWHQFLRSDTEELYLDRFASLYQELKKHNQLERCDHMENPIAVVQFADRWEADSLEKQWLAGEVVKAKGVPAVLLPLVVDWTGVKECMELVPKLRSFGSILCMMKEGMDAASADGEDLWNTFLERARRHIQESMTTSDPQVENSS